jgi:ESS family glutamate:Na+ symporter
MEYENGILQFSTFFSITPGILVLFVSKRGNDAIGFLSEICIPEPVTGGLIFSLLIALLYVISGIEVSLDLAHC